MDKGATVKGARTRLPSESAAGHRESPPLMDGRGEDWTPNRISDRKLLELAHRLEHLRSLGGPFTALALSPHAQARLAQTAQRN